MAQDVSGSIVKVTINGTTYDVVADMNLDQVPTRFKNEAKASSGRNMRVMTRQVEEAKSVQILCNATERTNLKAVAEQLGDTTLAYTTADTSVYRASGWIDFEKWESKESTATLTLFPRDKWEIFAAPA